MRESVLKILALSGAVALQVVAILQARAADSEATAPESQSRAPPVTRKPTPKPANSPAHTLRFNLGYGVGVASHDGSFIVQHGTLRNASGLGNAGQSYFAQAWLTGWPGRDWQAGLEYLHLQNVGTLNIDLPHGLGILTDPLTGTNRQEVIADIGFFNISFAPALSWAMRPYLGAGIGAGFGSGHYALNLHNNFIGNVTSISNGSSGFPGLQGFMGVDFPLSRHYYIGLQSKALWVTGHPVGVDQRYLDFILSFSLGAVL